MKLQGILRMINTVNYLLLCCKYLDVSILDNLKKS